MKGVVCVQPRNREWDLKVAGPMSFFVPGGLQDVFWAGVREHRGSVRDYLHTLLGRYRPLFNHGLLPSSEGDRCTREYQIRGKEKREKVTFRPFGGDWAEISNVALTHGLSVCRFFSLLLQLEAVGCGSEEAQKAIHVGIPTTPYATSTMSQQFSQTKGICERRYHQTHPHLPESAPKIIFYETQFR